MSTPQVQPSSNGNGQVDLEAVSDELMSEATVGYRPVIPLEALWSTGGDTPQITLRRDLEFMRLHPIVKTAMDYYRSGIAGAEFWGGPDQLNPDNDKGKPISPDPKIAQFILSLCERWWQRAVPLLQEDGYPYGWAPGEHVYKEVEGMMVWSHLKTFHPSDGHVLTYNYQPVGIRVKNIRGKQPVDLHFASESIPAKACWYAHMPRAGSLYGRSQYSAAWRPWRRLGWRDALEQIIDAACYRAGYKGPVVRHPTGHSAPTSKIGVPATQTDGGGRPRRENRDVARQIIEWMKAGAGITLSSEEYEGGGKKWDVEWPDHVMDVRPLIEAARYLEDHIMLGIGVPPELVRAGGTGSGYSGRSIPREAFLDGQQRVADALLQLFVEQVLRPLVLWNFGDISFNVQVKSLLKSQSDDKQGEQEGQQGKKGEQKPGQDQAKPKPLEGNPAPTTNPGAQQPALSIEAYSARALAIAERALKRMAA